MQNRNVLYIALFGVFVFFQLFMMFMCRLILAGVDEQVVADNIDAMDFSLNIVGPLLAILLLTVGYFVPRIVGKLRTPLEESDAFIIFAVKFLLLEFVGIIGFVFAMSALVYQVVYPYAVIAIVVMLFNYPSAKRQAYWLEDAGFQESKV